MRNILYLHVHVHVLYTVAMYLCMCIPFRNEMDQLIDCIIFILKTNLLYCLYRRIREKYETELKEVEKSERQTLEKYNTMKVYHVCTCTCTCNLRHSSMQTQLSITFQCIIRTHLLHISF